MLAPSFKHVMFALACLKEGSMLQPSTARDGFAYLRAEREMNRSLGELRLRAQALALVSQDLRDECVNIAREKSPSAAFDLASRAAQLHGLAGMHALAVAKATRWLSVIRRDHGEQMFEEIAKTFARNSV